MLFLMQLANTKHSSEFKATPCISHIILSGSLHLQSLSYGSEDSTICMIVVLDTLASLHSKSNIQIHLGC